MLFWTKYAFPRQIKPGIFKLTTSGGHSNLLTVFSEVFSFVKSPLKYLVAKLHGCYPGANSLPDSQNFFARFFSAPACHRFKSLFNFFTSLQQTQKTFFVYIFID